MRGSRITDTTPSPSPLRSGRIVSNGPSAPPNPSMPLMTSMEVSSYLRAVAEAATAQDATNLWQPWTAPTPLKRLQPKKTHRGGSQGRGNPKDARGGRSSNYMYEGISRSP